MARRKKTPETSRITRGRTVAYARKQKPDGSGEAADAPEAPDDAGLDSRFDVTDRSQPLPAAKPTAEAAPPEGSPPAAKPTAEAAPPAAPKPDPEPTAEAAPPAEPKPRREVPTVAMPVVAPVGSPPEMPAEPVPQGASPRADLVEDPTNMPGPKDIPGGSPEDPAPAPGRVPAGDSRSLRRRDATTYQFALIYRRDTFVITRFGVVGTRGQWRVVEYPTSAAASHAYAKECSRFVSDGFSDYRE
jgi:predicted DNA-binding WGR domain protein